MDLIDFLKSYADRFYNNDVNENAATLQKIGATPQVQIKNLGPDVSGDANYQTNTITFSKANPTPNDIAHETTHMLNNQMGIQAGNILQTPLEKQTLEQQKFLDAYKKLIPAQTQLPLDRSDAYRTNSSELRAFGVGNSSVPYNQTYAIPHVDATMATEFAILRSLFNKTLK